MRRVFRAVAIVVLASAMLNATTGLCLCPHTKPASAADHPESRDCCHRNALSIGATGTGCCHIQNVPHTATSPDVLAVAQPSLGSTPTVRLDARAVVAAVMALACSPSPPVRVLRV